MNKEQSKEKRTPEEKAFLEAYDPNQFERPSVTVNAALLSAYDGALHALLVIRDRHPDRGKWSLPGGFTGMKESLEDAAARMLRTRVSEALLHRELYLEQLYTFGEPDRDPRTRVITVAYYALVDKARFTAAASVGPVKAARLSVPWEGETGGPVDALDSQGLQLPLAFDHAEILGMAVKRIRGKLNYTPIGFQLLPQQFSLRELQDVHETILGRPLNKDSFRRRMLASDMLEATGKHEKDTAHRPAELYRFTRRGAV